MTDAVTAEQVLEVTKASGYLMEQEVGSLLENLGFVVSTNWAFQDQDEGISRDIDRLPFDRMWPDDELWMPHLFAGRPFTGRFVFDGDTMLDAVVNDPEPPSRCCLANPC